MASRNICYYMKTIFHFFYKKFPIFFFLYKHPPRHFLGTCLLPKLETIESSLKQLVHAGIYHEDDVKEKRKRVSLSSQKNVVTMEVSCRFLLLPIVCSLCPLLLTFVAFPDHHKNHRMRQFSHFNTMTTVFLGMYIHIFISFLKPLTASSCVSADDDPLTFFLASL